MKHGRERATKNVYVTSEHGVQINISTSTRLNATLKAQIDRNVNIHPVNISFSHQNWN